MLVAREPVQSAPHSLRRVGHEPLGPQPRFCSELPHFADQDQEQLRAALKTTLKRCHISFLDLLSKAWADQDEAHSSYASRPPLGRASPTRSCLGLFVARNSF